MFKENTDIDITILSNYKNYLLTTDPLLKDIPVINKIHTGGYVYKSGEKDLSLPLEQVSSTLEIALSEVYNYEIESICDKIYVLAVGLNGELAKFMFRTLTKITDFTGNVVDAKGKEFSIAMMLEVLEKIHIDFDKNGDPILPTMVIHPNMAEKIQELKSEEAAFKDRVDEIIAKKREAYYAEKGSRRLSRVD